LIYDPRQLGSHNRKINRYKAIILNLIESRKKCHDEVKNILDNFKEFSDNAQKNIFDSVPSSKIDVTELNNKILQILEPGNKYLVKLTELENTLENIDEYYNLSSGDRAEQEKVVLQKMIEEDTIEEAQSRIAMAESNDTELTPQEKEKMNKIESALNHQILPIILIKLKNYHKL